MTGKICGRVADARGLRGPVINARVKLYKGSADPQTSLRAGQPLASVLTDNHGKFSFCGLEEGPYSLQLEAFRGKQQDASVVKDLSTSVEIDLDINLLIYLREFAGPGGSSVDCDHAIAGRRFLVRTTSDYKDIERFEVSAAPDGIAIPTTTAGDTEVSFSEPGEKKIEVRAFDKYADDESKGAAYVLSSLKTYASDADRQMIGGNIGVRLERTRVPHTYDQALWVAIRNRTGAIGFHRYRHFIDRVLQAEERASLNNPILESRLKELGTPLHGVGAYQILKVATEVFLLMECGIRIEDERDPKHKIFHGKVESARLGEPVGLEYAQEKLREYLGSPSQLPYITRVIETAFPEWAAGSVCCDRVLTARFNEPCLIELIWSYWHEEGMLAQTMNAVTRRFQNVRGPERDPIAHLEIDPLRPVNNLVWGFIQDEIHRLSVKRRAYEYEHHYGLNLYGKALKGMHPADTRSKFLEAFHNLLHLASVFFKEDNDTTVIADGYPLLNALKEVHLLLAEGAHNQFGDLPWTARAEMMLQQWMLARPEIRDFLQSRAMVPYKEAWMPQVDTMKTLQGWSDVNVTHFRDLGVYGEQILLSVRYGDWIAINDEDSAKNWARYWRPEMQGYLHAYRAATGIDLTNPDTVDATTPAVLLQKRLVQQQQRAAR